MDPNRIRKRQLSTLHTARLFSSLLVLAGFLAIVTSIFLPVLPDLLPRLGDMIQEATAQSTTPESAVVEGAAVDEGAADSVQSIFPDWMSSWTLLLIASVLLWTGYLLKTIVVLAETQFVE